MNKKSNMNTLPSGDALDSEIFAAMCQEGWLIPQTVDEVLRAERELESKKIALSGKVSDPITILKQAARPLRLIRSEAPSSDSTVVENLARAARNGTVLSPEIEKRMRQDREKAERKDNG